ncbi:siderophore-interacting protein [Agreia sp. Leaf283]|uniref:siderophore-interacting protein n=1 Tax=Agreia sp. Leaf283 TaxID=1736321 RepID=UPI0006FDAAD2|nr:siderophore-interacting protein [Agreia sp. Leaf283]KQP57024.1 siderophore-interacting protein [Agreia sp. Leaf283]
MSKRATRTAPADPQLFRAHVVSSAPVTPSMERVTITGDGLADFDWMGYDHWFRLFMRRPHQNEFAMPEIAAATWWKEYLEIPEDTRPHCSNYTVADYRHEQREIDIDFVIHRGPGGELEGAAAIWACGARPGDQLALLDQGILFDRPDDATEVVIVADESGLPAVAGILKSLPSDTVGHVIQEVPTAHDTRDLAKPAGVTLSWVIRDDTHTVAGSKALDALRRRNTVDPRGYGFVVGESALATGGRRHLHSLGLPKSRITFSGFWKR